MVGWMESNSNNLLETTYVGNFSKCLAFISSPAETVKVL